MGTNKELKKMKCCKCNNIVENVGENAVSVTCDSCVAKDLDNAIENQEQEIMKGGQENMTEETKKEGRKARYLALEPKIIELSKAGKSASEIKKELGADSPGIPKLKRIIASKK